MSRIHFALLFLFPPGPGARWNRVLLLAVSFLFLQGLPAGACSESHLAPRLSREEALVRSKVPISISPGIGRVHFPTSTSSDSAQAFFDQGLSYLYSYAWWPAARSFRQALREDGSYPMARWGLAMAFFHLQETELAGEAMAAAQAGALARKLPAGERRWIALQARRLAAAGAPREHRRRDLEELRKEADLWLQEDAKNPFPWLLRGLLEEPYAMGRGQEGTEGGLPFYREALRLRPDLFPAHHFLGHSMENLGRFEEAELHGRRYRELAPAAPHAHHMYGHTLPALGRWQAARLAFREADRLHRLEADREGVPLLESWHFAHNRRFLALSELVLGEAEAAESYLRSIFRLPAEDPRGALYCAPLIELLLARGKYRRAFQAAGECSRNGGLGAVPIGRALAAEAAFRSGRRKEAEDLLKTARQALRELSEELQRSAHPPSPSRTMVVGLSRQLITLTQAQLALRDDPSPARDRALRTLAVLWTHDSRFDGWGQAVLLRLPRLESLARESGREDLAAEIHRLYRSKVVTGA